MKFCMPHWDAIRAAIKDRGLYALVPDSGEKAMTSMASQMQDGPSIDNFDPLMGAHWAIVGNLATNHPQILVIDGCPLCYANTNHALGCTDPTCTTRDAYYDGWIGKAADDQVAYWKELGEKS